jgi:hypothetical protein
MKKLIILPLTVIFSLFFFSCDPENMEFDGKAGIEDDVRVYSDTGNQADTTDKKGD